MRWAAIMFLAACHQQCGDNAGAEYARYLDPHATCFSLRMDEHASQDHAICTSGTEEWLCDGLPRCRPLGPPIRTQRVRTDVQSGVGDP